MPIPPVYNGGALRVVLLDSIPKWGGGEKWCVEAARALAGRGHRAVVACEADSPLEERAIEAGAETWPAQLSGGRGFLSALRLGRFLERERMEAVIGNVGRDLVIGAIACKRGGARLLQRRGLVRPVKRGILSRWLYTRAVDRIIVNSLAIRDRMLESAGFLDPSRFVLIPNGIETRGHAHCDGGRVRAELGLDPDAPVAATIGRLAEMKGQADLLRAWPRIRSAVPGAVLLVVGEGEEEKALKSLAGELSLGDSARFLGFRKDIHDLLDAIDVLVLPSVRDEGCSNTLLEAMGHGRPAVVTRCGGLPGVVTDGEVGLVVEIGAADALGSAVARLLAHPEERARMGAAARKTVEEQYSMEGATDLLEELLMSLRSLP